MQKRVLAMLLAVILTLGAAIPALANEASDFSDVPANHWAYVPIMEMAEQGVMKGVGGDRFDPNGELTAEMFLTLIGRVIFPDVEAGGADWSGPYVDKAKEEGLLERTAVTDETLKNGITRYDVAQILNRIYSGNVYIIGREEYVERITDERELGDIARFWEFDGAMLADWETIQNDEKNYEVSYVYVTGLMRGNAEGNFNGKATLTRMEAAVILQRFFALREQWKVARQARKERIQGELAAAVGEHGAEMSKEELTERLLQMDPDSLLWLSNEDKLLPVFYWYSTKEERQEALENMRLQEESFQAARDAAVSRQQAMDSARKSLDDLTGENIAAFTSAELANVLNGHNKLGTLYVSQGVNYLNDQDLLTVMKERGITAQMLEDAYWVAEENEVKPAVQAGERDVYEKATRRAAVIAIVAARMAKIEGKKSFTFVARAHTMVNDWIGTRDYNDDNIWYGLYGEDGTLLGKAKVYDRGKWEVRATIDPADWDQEFSIKLMEPYTFIDLGYRLLPDNQSVIYGGGGIRSLIEETGIRLKGKII